MRITITAWKLPSMEGRGGPEGKGARRSPTEACHVCTCINQPEREKRLQGFEPQNDETHGYREDHKHVGNA